MFNPKISGIVAGVAFILSFLIGLMSRSPFPGLLLRPLLFGIFFFILTSLSFLLVERFLPELTGGAGAPELDVPGSRIDITETEEASEVFNEPFAYPDESDEAIDDISMLTTKKETPSVPAPDTREKTSKSGMDPGSKSGMDQTGQTGYSELQEPGSSSGSGDSDGLADLESLVGVFMPSSQDEEEDFLEYPTSEPSKKTAIGNKPQKLESDFNPKELAIGIRNVLKKDEG